MIFNLAPRRITKEAYQVKQPRQQKADYLHNKLAREGYEFSIRGLT